MTIDQPPAVGLKDAESRLRWLAAMVIFNVVLSSSYQDALFLTYHQKPDIPPAMLVGSLLTATTTLGLNLLLRKRPAAGALRVILLVLGALTLGTAAWNLKPTSSSTVALFLLTEVATTLGVAATWTYFQAPLEAAQIRWLLPRLGTWAGLGGLIAGTAIPLLLRNLRIPPQILIWASGVAWVLAGWLVRSDYASRAPAKRRQSGSQQSHLQQLFSLPLVRWMTVGSAGITWTGLLLQYESRVALQATLWEPQKITLIMCILLAISNVGGIATQALVTTPVLEHFGVGLALAILPAALWVCLSAYFYSTAYAHLLPTLSVWIIMSALLLDKMLRPNLHRPAESCLVAALSPAIRPSLLLVLWGILAPLIKALGALLLWGFAATLEHDWITALALLLSLGVTVLSTRWGSLYARTLQETLEEGSVDSAGAADANEDLIPMIDGPRLRVLLEAIDTGSPRSRELAMELLRPHRSNMVQKAMQARVRHDFEPVRIAALRWLSEEPSPALETHLQQRWTERNISDRERVALLEAAGPLGATLLGDEVTKWVGSPNVAVRSAVIEALLVSNDAEKQALAREALGKMLKTEDPEETVVAMQIVHDHKIVEFMPAVLDHLYFSTDPMLRREVLNCLAAFDDERALRPLWAALSEPTVAHVAARALSSRGEAMVPELLGRLKDSETPPPVRLHLLRALGMIPSHATVPALIEHLKSPDRAAQLEALKSLNKLHRSHEQATASEAPLQEFLMEELRWGLNMLRARDLLKDRLRSGGLLWRELQAQIDSAQQRVALVLGLLAPKDTMVHIFKTLRSRNSPHRDQARELLRTLFKPGPTATGSLKLLDESVTWTPELFGAPFQINSGQTPQSAVEWLKTTNEPWVVAALKHDPDCPPLASALPQFEDPIEPHKDLVRYLKDVPLFEALTNRQLVEIARLAEKVDLPAGTLVFNQGDLPDYLYLVRKGKLRVLVGNQEVARLGAGECVGEMAVLASTRRTAGVETLESCQLLRFGERDFLGLVDAYPELGRALLKSLVHRLAAAGRSKENKRVSTIVGMVWGKDGPSQEIGGASSPNNPRIRPSAFSRPSKLESKE